MKSLQEGRKTVCNKTCDVTVGKEYGFPSKPHRKQWCFVGQLIAQSSNSKPKVSMFKFSQDPKLIREWIIKMNREYFMLLMNLRVCAEHFNK